jgi:Tol biopolymer transport system component
MAVVVFGYLLTRPVPLPRVLGYTQITNDGLQKGFFGRGWDSPMATDGSRLYFTEYRGPTGIMQVSASGGEAIPLAISVQNPVSRDASPNGSELLVGSVLPGPSFAAPLWAVPLPGGSPRRLGELIGQDGSWFSDGTRICFGNGADLRVAKSDGTDEQTLATAAGRVWWPRVSPEGNRVRFTVIDPKTNSPSLWEVAIAERHPHPLLPGWNPNPLPAECCGNWTPDGRYFVFRSTRNGRSDIWALREKRDLFHAPDRKPVPLTAGPLNYSAPLPSRDGKRLFVLGEQPRGELVRFDSKLQRTVPFLGGISADQVRFSHDGQWAAYVAHPEGTLWRCRVDGSQRLQLTFPPMQAALPRWSPDGKRIAFAGETIGHPWRTYLVSADGGAPQQVLPQENVYSETGWYPDGNSLIFGADPFAQVRKQIPGLYVVNLGSHQTSLLPGSEGLWSPKVSPDGRYIVTLSADISGLILYDLTTYKTAQLATGNALGWHEWSRDSKYVYFELQEADSRLAIVRVAVSDRKVQEIQNLKDMRIVFGPAGDWHGLTPDDCPLELLDVATQEIYALDVQFP